MEVMKLLFVIKITYFLQMLNINDSKTYLKICFDFYLFVLDVGVFLQVNLLKSLMATKEL